MKIETYKTTNKQKGLAIAAGLILETGAVVCLLVIFQPAIHPVLKVMAFGFSVCCQYLVIYGTLLGFKARLIIDSNGVCYKEPFKITMCRWEDFDQWSINGNELCLISTNKATITYPLLSKKLEGKKGIIPIHRFVPKWQTEEQWKTTPLLKQISELFSKMAKNG